MKGQTMEMLGFVILAVTIIGLIVFIRTYLVGNYGRTFLTLAERQQIEGVNSGANSILQTTIPSGKKIIELLGIYAYTQNNMIDLGRYPGVVDVKKEVEWRMDNIYGKGKWYLRIPYPDIPFHGQVIIIVDTSASLCDDVLDMKNNLPKIIEDLRQQGYDISATVYMLPGGTRGGQKTGWCCSDENPNGFELNCEGIFEETEYLHCLDINQIDCFQKYSPQNEEDWGRGLACVSEIGPPEGWNELSTKIGIVLSDELPGGNEQNINAARKSLDDGINSANKIGMMVFPLKTKTGEEECPTCQGCGPNICLMGYDRNWQWVKNYIFTEIQCKGDQQLTEFMKEIASKTGGEMYTLKGSEQATEALSKLFSKITSKPDEQIEIGTRVPSDKNVRTTTISLPVPFIGAQTQIYFYNWS